MHTSLYMHVLTLELACTSCAHYCNMLITAVYRNADFSITVRVKLHQLSPLLAASAIAGAFHSVLYCACSERGWIFHTNGKMSWCLTMHFYVTIYTFEYKKQRTFTFQQKHCYNKSSGAANF